MRNLLLLTAVFAIGVWTWVHWDGEDASQVDVDPILNNQEAVDRHVVQCKVEPNGEAIEVEVLERVWPKHPLIESVFQNPHTVAMEFCVSSEGQTKDVHVMASEPDDLFDEASVTALEAWTFEPYRIDGETVEVCGCAMTFVIEYVD